MWQINVTISDVKNFRLAHKQVDSYVARRSNKLVASNYIVYCEVSGVVLCHWTQGNAVPVHSVIDIQRSHTSNFTKKRSEAHDSLLGGGKAVVQFLHL